MFEYKTVASQFHEFAHKIERNFMIIIIIIKVVTVLFVIGEK